MKTQLILFTVMTLFLYQCTKDDKVIPEENKKPETIDKLTIESVNIGNEQTLETVLFTDATTGFAGGGDVLGDMSAVILKTTDAGKNWIKKHTGIGYYILKISSLPNNPNALFATTNKDFFLKSVDGGDNWIKIEVKDEAKEHLSFLTDIEFIDDKLGFVLGSVRTGEGTVFRTEDAGETWTAALAPEFETVTPLTNISIAQNGEKKTVLIAGGLPDQGIILRSEDSGKDWKLIDVSDEVQLTGIATNSNTTFAVGNNLQTASSETGELYRSTNFGQTWEQMATGFDNKLTQIAFKGNTIVVVGSNRHNNLYDPEFIMISKDEGESWQRIKHEHVVAGWNDVCFISDNKAIAVGHKGRAVITTFENE